MEPSNLPLASAPAERAAAAGELVVLNGRQSGTHRALGVPTTFIGRAPECDVRLNVEGVEPFHCVLSYHAGAASIRDLNSSRGTFVNGQRVTMSPLRDGDLLDVGPFRFRVLLPAPLPTAAVAASPEVERDAVHIQAAAIAAQQAALDEQEARLDHARVHMERAWEEAQQAMAQQRRHFQDELEAERAAVRAELQRQREDLAAELERERGQARTELQREREALETQRQQDDDELRLAREQLAAERQRLAKRSAALDRARTELQYQEGDLTVQQVQLNTEREVDLRLLQDGWRCLQEDQERWRRRRNRERTALSARRLRLIEGERRMAETRTAILREKAAWEAQQHALQAELHGLNNRIVHQRQQLQEHETRRALAMRPESETPAGPPMETALAKRSAELDQAACELADQRAQLVEQWGRLARLQHDWEARREETANELEALALRLARQEEALRRRERDLEVATGRLRQRQEQLEQTRREAALALARTQAQQQQWEAERAQVLAETTRLSEQARHELNALGALRRKWKQRRKEETELIRTERRTIAQLRQELTLARHALQEHARELEIARHTLAEEAQALQNRSGQSAEPRLGPTGGPGTALPRRWLTQNAAVVRLLRQQREAFAKELEIVTALQQELAEQAEYQTRAQADMQERRTALEYREVSLAAAEARLEQQMRQNEQRRWSTERQLLTLQEHTEHLARALIADAEPHPVVLERAA